MKKYQPKAEMNFVPFIDVMLVLLIIFMVTSQTIKKETSIDVKLPKASVEAKSSSDVKVADNVVLSMKGGEMYLTSTYFQFVDKRIPTLDSLGASVKTIIAERPDSRFYLRAEGESPYRSVTDVVGYMSLHGVDDVSLVLEGN